MPNPGRPFRRRQPNQRQKSDAEKAERDARIWNMRVAGHSERAIATTVGLSPAYVHELLVKGYQELVYPKVEEARQLTLERLDYLLSRLHRGVENGDVPSIQAAIKVEDRRAKLLGLDAPTRVQAEVEQVPPSPELLARIEQARTQVAARENELKQE